MEYPAQIIMFTATWCVPCKKMKPYWLKYIENNKNVSTRTIDIDQDQDELAEKFEIKKFPTMVAITNDGNILHYQGGESVIQAIYSYDNINNELVYDNDF